jgi:tetratricopeptide (TPR) repeat protein
MTHNTEALQSQVLQLVSVKDFQGARQLCDDAAKQASPEDLHYVLVCRSWVEWDAGEKHAAIASLRAARAIDPESRRAAYELCLHLLDVGNFSEAESVADDLIDLDLRRQKQPFIDSARMFKAYAMIVGRRDRAATQVLASIADQEAMWIAGRLISKSDLAELLD